MSTIGGEDLFNIGGRLAEERKRVGLSQETLGTRLATTGRTIKKYEGNETSPRAIELLQMHGLGMDVLYIVAGVRLPLGVAETRAAYTPAERFGEFVSDLDLSEADAEVLTVLAKHLVERR